MLPPGSIQRFQGLAWSICSKVLNQKAAPTAKSANLLRALSVSDVRAESLQEKTNSLTISPGNPHFCN